MKGVPVLGFGITVKRMENGCDGTREKWILSI